MLNECFDVNRVLSTSKLFSDVFEDSSKYAYHGTSIMHCNSIESSGFIWPFSAIEPSEIEGLAASLPKSEEQLIDGLKNAATYSTRISLSPYSRSAAAHAHDRKGGQVVGLCKHAIYFGANPSSRLRAQVEGFFSSDTCVYAIDISSFSYEEMVFENGAFYTTCHISVDLIKAKLIIPKDFELDKLKVSLNPRNAYMVRDSLASTLAKVNN